MKTAQLSYSRSFRIGLLGFILGGIIGALSTYLVFSSGVLTLVVELVSPGQPFLRYLFGIVLAFFGIGLGGAIDGLVCGYTLYLIDQAGSRPRYLLGGAFSTGISQGILVIPIMLFISLVSIYNVGSQKDPASFIVLFAIIGFLFGLLNGAILALITLRLRYAWIVVIGFAVASTLGGALFGLLIWNTEWILSEVKQGISTLIFLILPGVMIYSLAGGVLGIIYFWLGRKRNLPQSPRIEPRHSQDILAVTIALVIFLGEVSLINHLSKFVTVYPGKLTTSLNSETVGVHWQESKRISSDLLPNDDTSIGLSVSPQYQMIVWTNESGEILVANQQFNLDKQAFWSDPINASMSPRDQSVHPQVAVRGDGTAYIVWSENGDIWLNSCHDNLCGNPENLTSRKHGCLFGATTAENDWPAIALAKNNTVMVAWYAGDGFTGYATWDTSTEPNYRTAGCLSSDLQASRPRLAVSKPGEFWLVLSEASNVPNRIILANYQQGKWDIPRDIGMGNFAEVYSNQNGNYHLAWCGVENEVNYLEQGNLIELLTNSACQNRSSIISDNLGQIHLIYTTNQWLDNFGNIRQGKALMESIRQPDGWSEPAIVAPLNINAQQEATGIPDGDMHLTWVDTLDGQFSIRHSTQPAYLCDESTLSESMQVILDVVQNGQYHPKDYRPPFCGNHFIELIFLPVPPPGFSVLSPGEEDGFDQLADLILETRNEVLFSMMQWDTDKDNLSPGSRIAQAISTLYQQVKTNPEAYPRGMTIKILLGNYPNLSTLQMGDQIWNVIQDLADMGVETMEDPQLGWKVEIANFKGSFPHSHTKFLVVDGKILMSAGFNISWDHLPKDHRSRKGIDMTDLGIVMSGPIAQTGVTVFDEMWQDANQLICGDLIQGDIKDLKNTCSWQPAEISHNPETLNYYLPGDTAAAFGLYRTANYKESDEAYHAVLASAHESIDIIHANFTAELICDVNLLFSSVCTFKNSLPYMQSLVDAVEQKGVHLRILVEKENMNGMENQVGIQILLEELKRRNLDGFLEIRYFNGRLHTKSVMIDDQLLIIGSQNFHYSSISEGGLNEFNIMTDAPEALDIYQDMFEYYWQEAIPVDDIE